MIINSLCSDLSNLWRKHTYDFVLSVMNNATRQLSALYSFCIAVHYVCSIIRPMQYMLHIDSRTKLAHNIFQRSADYIILF